MPRSTTKPMPSVQCLLQTVGENLRLARLRRRLSLSMVAERAGMDRKTLRRVEHGDPRTTLGAYANVLHCLGLVQDLAGLARDDVLGRKLQDLQLEVPARAPRRRVNVKKEV